MEFNFEYWDVDIVRQYFKDQLQKRAEQGDADVTSNLVLPGASFICDEPSIFGTPNQDYINAEIEWYYSQSTSVDDLAKIYGKRIKIWDDVACRHGMINSNYGKMIFGQRFGCKKSQYDYVRDKLKDNPTSRHGIMIYTEPTMHEKFNINGRYDFTCTNAVHYEVINNKYLNVVVQMRSNDAVFGYNNDFAWQNHVAIKLSEDLGLQDPPQIYWQVANLHVYPRHFDLVAAYE